MQPLVIPRRPRTPERKPRRPSSRYCESQRGGATSSGSAPALPETSRSWLRQLRLPRLPTCPSRRAEGYSPGAEQGEVFVLQGRIGPYLC